MKEAQHTFPNAIEPEIAHVLFADIVGYSNLTMDEQTRLRAQLKEIVRATDSYRHAQDNQKVISRSTGDGMALVFFGHPAAPVNCALEICRTLRSHPELKLRMGVHTGPVRRDEDINDQMDVAGGGINFAQRVMDIGDSGHVLLTKAVAENLGQLGGWVDYLHDLGEVTVKHGARVHIFNLYGDGFGNPDLPEKFRLMISLHQSSPSVFVAPDQPSKETPTIAEVKTSADYERGPAEGAPLRPGKSHAPSATRRTKEPASKILVVDDSPTFREALIDIFTDADITFVEAGCVEEAKEILAGDREIQIILLDLELPGENGANLLKHLMHRASDYRVIILTGHDELLPAYEAAIYNVFQYLSKSEKGLTGQSLRFAVEQARQDIEREKLAKKNKSDEFDDVVLNKYPTPFTYIYQELKSDLVALETLTRQKDIFELLLNFSAVVLMCEYFDSGVRNEELDARIRDKIFRLSLGDWFNIINEIFKRKPELQTTLFLESFSSFYTGANRRSIGDLIGIRNRYLGHGAKLSEYEYNEVTRQFDKQLVPLLRGYQFITHFLLCYVWNVQKVRSGYKYRLKECTGANPQLLFSKRDLNFLMNANEVYLVNLNNEQFQSLHPFIILEHCTDCKQLEMFFYVKYSNDQMHYLSYKTGHTLSTGAYAKEFMALINVSR